MAFSVSMAFGRLAGTTVIERLGRSPERDECRRAGLFGDLVRLGWVLACCLPLSLGVVLLAGRACPPDRTAS